ncbi:hypothetical protein BH09ACT9_BH09ACT9_00450 [soil metagenome]
MTQHLSRSLGSGDCLISYPGGNRLIPSGFLDQRVLIGRESELNGLGTSIVDWRSASGSLICHGGHFTVNQKNVANPDYLVYNKYMSKSTTTPNATLESFIPVWHGCMLHNANHCEDCESCDCFLQYECPDCGEGHDGMTTGTEYCEGCQQDRDEGKAMSGDESE